ncbi:MAG: hypothetical protein ABI591_27840 [Kofleriaceae bacterium]
MKSLACLIFVAACGSSSPPPAPPTPPPAAPADAPAPVATASWFDDAMVKMRGFSDAMCACKDMACAQKVGTDMSTWSAQMEKDHPEQPKLTDDQTKTATELGQKLGECMGKFSGGGSGR